VALSGVAQKGQAPAVVQSPLRPHFRVNSKDIAPMATQPPFPPDRIDPQSPPESPPAAPEPAQPWPDESEPASPGYDVPGQSPAEFP
jgi:hypothetical protein